MMYLDMLNGYFTTNNFDDFNPGPSIERINFLINELGFSKGDLNKLIWKTDTGVFRRSQSFKEWLNLIYQKITTYNSEKTNADEDIAKLTNALKDLHTKSEYDLINPNTDKYTPNEIRMAKAIFDAAQHL